MLDMDCLQHMRLYFVLCSLDIPKAPKLLGSLVGQAAVESVLGIDALPDLSLKCEAAEPRRAFAAAALSHIKVLQLSWHQPVLSAALKQFELNACMLFMAATLLS